jgi:signal transduction histidine kinase
MPAINSEHIWRYARNLLPAALLVGLVVRALYQPLRFWVEAGELYDRGAMHEWIKEARVYRETLPELAGQYLDRTRHYLELLRKPDPKDEAEMKQLRLQRQTARMAVYSKRADIFEHLRGLAEPPTKMYAGQLPLFPVIYRMQLNLETDPGLPADMREPIADMREPIVWDSELPRRSGQYKEIEGYAIAEQLWPGASVNARATLDVQYQLHAFNRQQRREQVTADRGRLILAFAVAGAAVVFAWMWLVQHRERQRLDAQQQIEDKERLLLREEVRRQEAELRHEDTERKLLEQRLATQAAERQALELKSQLYASIGIMAGSYAHNIKNLLVRPNDLLRRCLEADSLSGDQQRMLNEVRQTLGTVTERLQQILRTVRRDPSRSELTRLDLNDVLRDLERTWKDLAREKWKLELTLDLDQASGPLWINGDLSHLQQAVENLVFNARDATFEMRGQMRMKARERDWETETTRQALIAAAAWRGSVLLRTSRQAGRVVLELRDNGIGMTEEVRSRCTETHFSTKRDNALYEGAASGMGLGLSFVVVILEHHGATLEIESEPLRGTTFRVSFPTGDKPLAA